VASSTYQLVLSPLPEPAARPPPADLEQNSFRCQFFGGEKLKAVGDEIQRATVLLEE
jgi:hypothetical protein